MICSDNLLLKLKKLPKPIQKLIVAKLLPISLFVENTTRLQLCPFHPDNKPSAKIYKDPDCERLFCFACNRQYTSYDYIRLILEKDPLQYLLSKVSPELIQQVLFQLSNGTSLPFPTIDFDCSSIEDCLKQYERFILSSYGEDK